MSSRIEINDRVTCINATGYPTQKGRNVQLVEGRDYIVYGLTTNPCCGTTVIDVGLTGTGASICKCGHEYIPANEIVWKNASRFRKKEETKEVVYNVSKVVESVETCNN